MLAVTWQTLRSRALLYAGTFAALWLGVSLVAATGLVIGARSGAHAVSRFGGATVVVTADPVLRLRAPSARPGTPGGHYQTTLPNAPMLALSQVRRLARLPGVSRAVADRTFPVQLLGRDGRVVQVPDTQTEGHGWASASFGLYRLAAGSPPEAASQVVLDRRLAAAGGYSVGDTVRLLTPAGPVDVHVSGITALTATTDASVFFTSMRVGQLSGYPGQVSAAVLTPVRGTSPAALAALVRRSFPRLRVLTGTARASAEPDPLGQAIAQTGGLLGLMAGLGGFVTIFVVAGTMGFAITQRRRELALLRLAGATPRQVRRMLLGEAAAISVLASLAAAAAVLPAGDIMLAYLRHLGVAPAALRVHLQAWPLLIASGIGLAVALAGAWAPSRRTRRIRPAEALRRAAAEQRPMTKTRWAAGVICLAGGTAMLIVVPQTSGNAGLAPAGFAGLVLITGIALLGPALARPLAGLAGLPLTRGPLARVSGPGAGVARDQLRAQPRRTASLAAPVLLLVGIAGSLLALASATQAATAADLRRQVAASLIAETTATPPGLATPAIAAIAATPGVAAVAAPIPIDVYVPTRARLEDIQANGAGPAVTSGAGPLRYPVLHGSLSALAGQAVAVSNQEAALLGWQPGRQVRAWLGDGTAVRLRVVATYDAGLSGPALLLPRALAEVHAAPGTATTAYIQLQRHASPPAVIAALRRSLAGTGTTIRTRAEYLLQARQSAAAGENIGLTAMLTVALLYVAIAVVNTLVMAGRERVRELAQFRLAGATRAQALGVPAWEAAMIATTGITLGLAVTAITTTAVPIALRHLGSAAATTVPWQVLLAIVGGSAVLVLVPSLAVGAVALRPRPLDGLMIPE